MTDARPIKFSVEYSKSNRSSCKYCGKLLAHGQMRLCRETPSPFHDGYVKTYFHYECLWKKFPLEQDPKSKRKLAVTARSVRDIEGFGSLRPEDQKKLRNILNEKEDHVELEKGNGENEKRMEQMKKEWNLKDKLKNCELKVIKSLIKYNDLPVEGGRDTLINIVSEGILYGIPLCPQCKTRGSMKFIDDLYRCRQELEWGYCGYRGLKDISFETFKIDPHCGVKFLLQWNEARQPRIPSSLGQRSQQAIASYKRNPNAPLQSMKFSIAGHTERAYHLLKTIIVEHGGSFYDEITHDIDYVITTYEDLNQGKKYEKKMKHEVVTNVIVEKVIEVEEPIVIEVEKEPEILDRIPLDESVVEDSKPTEIPIQNEEIKEETIVKQEEETKELSDYSSDFNPKIVRAMELGLAFVTELLVDRLIKEFGFNQKPYILEGSLPPIALAKLDTESKSSSDENNESQKSKYDDQVKFGEVHPQSKIQNGKMHKESISLDGKDKMEIYDVYLTKSDITSNSNKFYRMQLIDVYGNGKMFSLFCKWGRIGTHAGGTKVTSPSSLSSTMTQWKEKYLDLTMNTWEERHQFVKKPGRYHPILFETQESQSSMDGSTDDHDLKSFAVIPSLLDLRLQGLIQLIFDQEMMRRNMAELDIDVKRLPIGNISKKTLEESYGILKQIESVLESSDSNKNIQIFSLSNKFYTLIPHDFGMKTADLIDNKNRLKSKMKQIEALTNIEIASSVMKGSSFVNINPLDINYKSLGISISPLAQYSSEYKLISKCVHQGYLPETLGSVLEVMDAFKVEREDEIERFNAHKHLKSKMLLWHGSRLCNFVGILSNGLKIAPPEAPRSGYMFGKGIYFADLIQKSASYTHPDPKDKIGLLLLCEVALGEMYEVKRPEYISELPKGKNSTKALSKMKPERMEMTRGCLVPTGKPVMDADINDAFLDEAEYVVYDESQVKISYIVKIKFNPLNK